MTATRIRLRLATPEDAPLLRHWDEQPHVLQADPDSDWAWEATLPHNPDWREQLIAEVAGRPIGYIQIMDPARDPEAYWGDVDAPIRAIDIWIGEADCLGQGFGTEMMKAALERCFDDHAVSGVLIDPLVSNTRAHRFYRRLGFRPVGERWFDQDHCLVHKLSREQWREVAARSARDAG